MWLVLFTIPFLKYPANPPTVGDGETVMLRGILYLSFIAISGFAALGFYQMYKRLKPEKRIFNPLRSAKLVIGFLYQPAVSGPIVLHNKT